MRHFIFFITILLSSATLSAQGEAETLLDRMKQQLMNEKGIQFNYTLTISVPEQQDVTISGELKKEGAKYYASMGERWVKSNGKTQWIFNPDLNEVQVYDAEQSESMPISPEAITEMYESEDYEYALTGKETINGKKASLIEFKALDPADQYFKMRLAVETATAHPIYFKVFERDGSRYSLEIDDIKKNLNFDDQLFTFDKSQYPDVNVEDLRM